MAFPLRLFDIPVIYITAVLASPITLPLRKWGVVPWTQNISEKKRRYAYD